MTTEPKPPADHTIAQRVYVLERRSGIAQEGACGLAITGGSRCGKQACHADRGDPRHVSALDPSFVPWGLDWCGGITMEPGVAGYAAASRACDWCHETCTAEINRLRVELERTREALERIGGPVGDSRCPNCSGHLDDSFEHYCGADDCAGFIARRALAPTPDVTKGEP